MLPYGRQYLEKGWVTTTVVLPVAPTGFRSILSNYLKVHSKEVPLSDVSVAPETH
jgi:hypothetical protein